MTTALHWLAAHWPTIIAALGTVLAIATVINGNLDYEHLRDGAAVKRWLGVAIDVLALVVRKDSPGSLSAPGLMSNPPLVAPGLRDTPTDPSIRRARAATPPPPIPPAAVLMCLALAVGGCSAQQRAGECTALGMGTVALNAIASVFVSLIGDGVNLPAALPGWLDTAGRVVAGIEHSACPQAMPPLGDRVRQAIAAHPIHGSVMP